MAQPRVIYNCQALYVGPAPGYNFVLILHMLMTEGSIDN